jgi:polyphenol oxidase
MTGAATAPASWMWPADGLPPGVRAVFTSREGGVSHPPFDSFNLGDHVRDEAAAVAANRARFQAVMGAQPVFLSQVHGTDTVLLQSDTSHGTEADACVSDRPGLACTIMVADCLPVLFAHASGGVVAAAHAGWRGLAGGVLESCFETYADAVEARLPGASRAGIAAETWVWIGPCIGPTAFEVGGEVREAFMAGAPAASACFEAVGEGNGKHLADLSGLARLRLQAMGLTGVKGNDGSASWCTVTQASAFFSHRRDAARLGSTGRMAAAIWIVG